MDPRQHLDLDLDPILQQQLDLHLDLESGLYTTPGQDLDPTPQQQLDLHMDPTNWRHKTKQDSWSNKKSIINNLFLKLKSPYENSKS
jgi:hypothetical protein